MSRKEKPDKFLEQQKRAVQEEQRKKEQTKEQKNKKSKGSLRPVGFLYDPPPGYLPTKKKEEREEEDKKKVEEDKAEDGKKKKKEKVDPYNYEELGKRFPFLKNAPTSNEFAKHITIKHNPVGILIRNVRCARCGNYGHRSGERECPMYTAVTLQDEERRQREDPMSIIKPSVGNPDNLVISRGQENVIYGGYSADDPLQQLIEDDEEEKERKKKKKEKEEAESSEEEITALEQDFFESLSEKEMKILLKRYKKANKKGKKKSKKAKKKSSKTKKKKKSKSSSSSSSDSDSDSSSSSDSDSQKKKKNKKRKRDE